MVEYKPYNVSYGHIILNTPDPVRSPQLKSIESSQYYGGGPHGNTTCCNFFHNSLGEILAETQGESP